MDFLEEIKTVYPLSRDRITIIFSLLNFIRCKNYTFYR